MPMDRIPTFKKGQHWHFQYEKEPFLDFKFEILSIDKTEREYTIRYYDVKKAFYKNNDIQTYIHLLQEKELSHTNITLIKENEEDWLSILKSCHDK